MPRCWTSGQGYERVEPCPGGLQPDKGPHGILYGPRLRAGHQLAVDVQRHARVQRQRQAVCRAGVHAALHPAGDREDQPSIVG